MSGNGKLDLSKADTNVDGGLSKEEGLIRLEKAGAKVAELAELLFASGTHSVLVVLQGRDTAGKDGSIRRILTYVNVQSTRVVPFKVPTATELAHDFLWRVHPCTPGKGEISIFNRSHYEDVIAVRVHELAPEKVWRRRYEHIRNFETLLTDSSVIVVKFFLNIAKSEQEKRLLEREKDPIKAWKLNAGDWKERAFWGATSAAYEDAIAETDTKNAPWYVVPADKKWYRDLMIAEHLVSALQPYEKDWRAALEKLGAAKKLELEAFRKAETS